MIRRVRSQCWPFPFLRHILLFEYIPELARRLCYDVAPPQRSAGTEPSVGAPVGIGQTSPLSWPRSALCPCARLYYNGPKLCVTLAHFLPFKSCFGRSTQTYRNITHCRVESTWDEACPGTEYTGYDRLIQKYLAKVSVYNTS